MKWLFLCLLGGAGCVAQSQCFAQTSPTAAQNPEEATSDDIPEIDTDAGDEPLELPGVVAEPEGDATSPEAPTDTQKSPRRRTERKGRSSENESSSRDRTARPGRAMEGSAALERFEVEKVLKSHYKSNGTQLEVDPE